MDLLICIRKTEDWQTVTLEKIRSNEGTVFGYPIESVTSQIKCWNNLLTMPYFEFRRQLKEITLENLRQIRFCGLYVPPSDPDLNYLRSLKNTWIVINDDDDYLHPSLHSRLLSIIGEKKPDIVTWNGVVNQSYPSQEFYDWNGRNTFVGSNQYAIHSNCLEKLTDKELFVFINEHHTSEKIAAANNLEILRSDEILSIYNSHCGGCFRFTNSRAFYHFFKTYIPCKEMKDYHLFAEHLTVFEPYINAFYDVMNQVKPINRLMLSTI